MVYKSYINYFIATDSGRSTVALSLDLSAALDNKDHVSLRNSF